MYSMGVALYAAHNIAMQFLSITFSLADGIAIAGTSLVGQKLGEKRYDLSMMYGHVCYRIAISVSLALASFIVALRTPISSLFINSNTPNAGFVVTAAAQTMIVVAIMQPFQMGSVVYSGSLRGAGDNLYVAKVMALCVSILRPLLAILAVRVLKLSLPMTWLLSLSEMALRAILFARRFSSGKWRESRV
jgi:Na+-driven multidrug efflux pump